MDAIINPKGPQEGRVRVSRGGSWTSNGMYCRSAFHGWGAPEMQLDSLGFRVVVELEEETPMVVQDPVGPQEGRARVVQGGSWINYGRYCRSAYHGRDRPGFLSSNLGFRVVVELEEETPMVVQDPVGPEEGQDRASRGGSWDSGGKSCRSAYRGRLYPRIQDDDLGFRISATEEQAPTESGSSLRDYLLHYPADSLAWLAWADKLEEKGQDDRANLLRAVTWLRVEPDHAFAQTTLLDLLARGVDPPVVRVTNKVGISLTLIPPGLFWMGSPDTEEERHDDEGPRHKVAISAFLMGTHAVTQEQYQAVMGQNPSRFLEGSDAPKRPVEQVSWNDAVAFCSKLSELDGRKYRLPTEAEWEYACRASTTTPFAFGDSLSSTQANFNGNYPYGGAPKGPYIGHTTPVGSYKPNAFGLHDMHGNVWEWCNDWYDAGTYRLRTEAIANQPAAATDLTGPEEDVARVLRGGSWYYVGGICRSAFRSRFEPDDRYLNFGFRLAVS